MKRAGFRVTVRIHSYTAKHVSRDPLNPELNTRSNNGELHSIFNALGEMYLIPYRTVSCAIERYGRLGIVVWAFHNKNETSISLC